MKKVICICAVVVGICTVVPVTTFAQEDVTTSEDNSDLMVAAVIANGEVTGDGVRLRSTPSTSGTVLELMYTGEKVHVDTTKITTSGGTKWYYVTRIKNGNSGWVSSAYIELW